MALHTFDLPSFQAACPALAETDPVALAATFGVATATMTAYDGCILSGATLQLSLNLMTGHLTQLGNLLGAGQTAVGPVTGAAEGTVNISLQPPPATSGWQFWLASTPYGVQLWALLQVQTAGGIMVGASLERASFRGAGGVFGGGRCF